jgi:hypothetical protein
MAGTALAVSVLKRKQEDRTMKVAKVMELTSESEVSFEEATRVGIARAAQTVDHIQGAWIKEQKVVVSGGVITRYRVDLKVTFLLRGP